MIATYVLYFLFTSKLK